MRTVTDAKPLLILAGILLMLAHSVVPAPACNCARSDADAPSPCHRAPDPEPSPCCERGPAESDGACLPGLDATCCKRAPESQEESPVAVLAPPDVPVHPDAPAAAVPVRPATRPSVVRSTAAPPAPPGAPAWLRHATLLI